MWSGSEIWTIVNTHEWLQDFINCFVLGSCSHHRLNRCKMNVHTTELWGGFRTQLFRVMRNVQAFSVFYLEKKQCHKTRCLPNPKSCPCVSVYTERVVSCKDILSSKRWEIDSTSQHLLCFAFSVMRFGQSVDVISDPVGILPCSIYILNVYPVLVLFWTLADITSSQCTHHSASVSFFQIFFTVDTSSVYKVFLEGAGNQLIPSLALDSEVF